MNRATLSVAAVLAALVQLWAGDALAIELTKGQTLYVPCYSQIYHGIKTRPIDLTITLSVRNPDPHRAVTLASVDYHDTTGKLVKSFLASPKRIEPLMTTEFIIGQTDTSGGSGASFMVTWTSDVPTNPVIVEAVMIGTGGQQGISFASWGTPVETQ